MFSTFGNFTLVPETPCSYKPLVNSAASKNSLNILRKHYKRPTTIKKREVEQNETRYKNTLCPSKCIQDYKIAVFVATAATAASRVQNCNFCSRCCHGRGLLPLPPKPFCSEPQSAVALAKWFNQIQGTLQTMERNRLTEQLSTVFNGDF